MLTDYIQAAMSYAKYEILSASPLGRNAPKSARLVKPRARQFVIALFVIRALQCALRA